MFFIILGLNLLEKRFWCKYLCPLGALLGLFSRFAFLQRSVSEGCNSCGACDFACQGGASPDQKEKWHNTECMTCMNCDDLCPQNAVRFGFFKKTQAASVDLGKRRIIGTILSGLAAVPLMRITAINKQAGAAEPRLIRPPGSLDEKQFLARCVKCGECMKVCITVDLELCIGCGLCEAKCPLIGQPAIYVTSIGESRSKENQLLLS